VELFGELRQIIELKLQNLLIPLKSWFWSQELDFTDEIINYQGEDSPVEGKPNNQKWRWRIW